MEINVLDFIVWFVVSILILYVGNKDSELYVGNKDSDDAISFLKSLLIVLIFSFIYIILFVIIDYDMIDVFNYEFTKIKITL